MNSEYPLVIYHADCFDGHTAAWLFHNYFGGRVDFWPAKYGDKPPLEEAAGRMVFVVDFSYKRNDTKALILSSRSCHALDHHKTAEAELSGILEELQQLDQRQPGDRITFDMNRSGASLAFDLLYQTTPRWWLVDYVEDRDLWRQALPDSELVTAYYASFPLTFENWSDIQSGGIDAAIAGGAAVKRYIDTYGQKAIAQARFEWIDGLLIPVINLPYMNSSEHVTALLRDKDAPVAASYFRRADGRWQFSLRSRSDFDCSEIAKRFGGGGHAQAAGFDVQYLPWEHPLGDLASNPILMPPLVHADELIKRLGAPLTPEPEK